MICTYIERFNKNNNNKKKMNPSEKCNLSIEFLLLDIVYPFNQLW